MILPRDESERIVLDAIARAGVRHGHWQFNKQRSVVIVLHGTERHAYSVGGMSRAGIDAVAQRIITDANRERAL